MVPGADHIKLGRSPRKICYPRGSRLALNRQMGNPVIPFDVGMSFWSNDLLSGRVDGPWAKKT